jgi:hypothetical protein
VTSFTSPPITVRPPRDGFGRADIVFEGVEQAGPSFGGLVFLNNPEADASTAPTPENGFAGGFHVYGFGPQTEPRPPGTGDAAGSHAREPITASVIATDAVRRALEDGNELTVTVVPQPDVSPLEFDRVSVVFDDLR